MTLSLGHPFAGLEDRAAAPNPENLQDRPLPEAGCSHAVSSSSVIGSSSSSSSSSSSRSSSLSISSLIIARYSRVLWRCLFLRRFEIDAPKTEQKPYDYRPHVSTSCTYSIALIDKDDNQLHPSTTQQDASQNQDTPGFVYGVLR